MARIYRHPTQPTVDLPNLDLLTLLFGKCQYPKARMRSDTNKEKTQNSLPHKMPRSFTKRPQTRRTPSTKPNYETWSNVSRTVYEVSMALEAVVQARMS